MWSIFCNEYQSCPVTVSFGCTLASLAATFLPSTFKVRAVLSAPPAPSTWLANRLQSSSAQMSVLVLARKLDLILLLAYLAQWVSKHPCHTCPLTLCDPQQFFKGLSILFLQWVYGPLPMQPSMNSSSLRPNAEQKQSGYRKLAVAMSSLQSGHVHVIVMLYMQFSLAQTMTSRQCKIGILCRRERPAGLLGASRICSEHVELLDCSKTSTVLQDPGLHQYCYLPPTIRCAINFLTSETAWIKCVSKTEILAYCNDEDKKTACDVYKVL